MSAPGRRIVESAVGAESEGLRLDVFLAKRFTYRSRAQWQTSIEEGEILLNGARSRASRALHEGERISFTPKDAAEPEVPREFPILAETADYLVVDKPAGLPCHPAGRYFSNTLWALLSERYEFANAVNRLDRETSGVTLVAKNPQAASKLSALLAGRKAAKTYIALIHGDFPEGGLEAEGFLIQAPGAKVNKRRAFVEKAPPGVDAESCSTSLRLIAKADGLSAVEAIPHTGRLHQIRATLHSLGFPMLGDKLYGLDETLYLKQIEGTLDARDRDALRLPRQALHAARLEFRCPFTGAELRFEARLPEDLRALHPKVSGV